jgi:hypothetical protein
VNYKTQFLPSDASRIRAALIHDRFCRASVVRAEYSCLKAIESRLWAAGSFD